ncbi:hypothetical protein UFOVP152_9 [uncultured Caudovirales phage]|uniref:Phage tail lysozyme domain-containing protein n=1 Tax=uncultured Caudovirales phage TaxID=2100421 RepID=A0A6J7WBD3_9CAUD|nr:hypothetical protein UFOVP152_9 [uncultured Caudovirales phage]
MARVPTYDSLQVNPTTQGVAAPSVSPLKVAGEQMQEAGAHLMSAGQTGGAIVSQLQQQVNATRVQQAVNTLTNKKTAYSYGFTDANGVRTPGYTEIKGEAAMHVEGPDGKLMPLQQAYGAKLQKDIDDLATGLSNDEQRRLFMENAGRTQAQFANETGSHQAQQMQVWAKGVAQDQVLSAANAIASAPNDPAIWAVQSLNLRQGIDKQLAQAGVMSIGPDGKRNFASDEARTVYDTESKVMTASAFEKIAGSLRDNGQAVAALNFIDAHKDEVSQTDYKRLRGAVLEQASASMAIGVVDQVTAKYWSDHSQSPDQEKVDKALRDQFKNDPVMLRAARSEFSARVSDWSFTHQQQSNDAQQSAMKDIAAGKSIAYIQSQPYWSRMQGGDQLAVINSAQGFADSRTSHATVAGERAAGLNADYVAYAVQSGMPEHLARAMAAVFSGETNNDPNAFNPTGGGQGAFGLFQARGDLQRGMKAKYGDHPTWQQQIDFYSGLINKTPAVLSAQNEGDAVRAMVTAIQKPGQDTDALIARSLGALQVQTATRQIAFDANADALLADPSQIGELTPQNVQRIQNMVGQRYAPKVIAAARKWQSDTTRAALPTSAEMNSILSGLGITTGQTKDAKVMALRAQVRSELQAVLVKEAKDGATITDPSQRADILQKAAAATVQVFTKGWFGLTNIEDRPLLSLKPEDKATMIVPAGERAAIADSLRRHGIPVTDNNLRKAWLQAQGMDTRGL